MLKLKHIKLKNFMNIASADLDLSNKMNLFQGNPGQGKSAVFEAISCCLSTEKKSSTYGEYVRRQKDMEDAEIVLDADIYGKPAEFKMSINEDGGVSRSFTYDGETRTAAKDIDKALNELELRYYASIFLSMQGAHDISDMSPAERAKYIQKLLDFSFDEEITKAEAKIEEVKDLIIENDKDISAKEAVLTKLKNTEYVEKPLPFTEEVYNSYLAEMDAKQQELIEISALASKKVEAQQKLTELTNLRTEKKFSLNDTMAKIEKHLTLKESRDSAQSKIDEYETNVSKLNSELEEVVNTYNLTNTHIGELNASEISYNSSKAEVSVIYKNLLAKKTLISKGICPECGQPVHDLDVNIDAEIIEQKDRLDSFTQMISMVQNSKDNATKDLIKINNEQARLKSQISSLNALIKSQKALLEQPFNEAELEDLRTFEDELVKDISAIESLINKALEDVDSIDIKDSKIVSARIGELSSLTTSYIATIAENKDILSKAKQQAEDIKSYSEALEACYTNKEKLTIRKADYDDALKILKVTLPQFMSISICQKFTSLMNDFINKVFDDFTVRLDFKKTGCIFEYTKRPVEEDNWLNTKMASGYEKAILTLSFKYALSCLYNIDIFIGDEIDKAANDEFSEKFFDSLLNCGQFNQIFIISHHEYLKDFIENNFSSRKCYIVSGGNFVEDY